MAGPRHQATVAQPVQQVIQPWQAVEFSKLLLNPGLQIPGPPHAAVWILGLLIQVVLDLLLLGIAQPALVAAAATIDQSVQSLGVVLTYPMLQLPTGYAQHLADLGGGPALLGQPDDLYASQQTGILLPTDQALQFFEAVMLCHMHGSPPCENQHAIASVRAQP